MPFLQPKPLHDVDELLRARHVASCLGDHLRERLIARVAGLKPQHEFGQDHPQLLLGAHLHARRVFHHLANSLGHASTILEVERPQERERFDRRDVRVCDQQALHCRRIRAAAPPDDLPSHRVLRPRGLRQPGLEPAVPQTISPDAEGFEFPAVAGLVLRGKRSPRPIGPLAGKALQCKCALPTNGDGRIGHELLHEAKHVSLREPAHPQGDDPEAFVLVGSEPRDPGLGLARQHARRPGKPGP